jgi:hypothetical protein
MAGRTLLLRRRHSSCSTPAATFNAIARRFVDERLLDLSDSARLFAMLNISAADADPTWTQLFDPSLDPAIGGAGPALTTPPYPDHPSGATGVASASMHAFASFFGTDEMTFYATSSRFPGEHRVFRRFSDLTAEVLDARIWAGIHFRNPDVQAEALGRDVARYVRTHYFAAAR